MYGSLSQKRLENKAKFEVKIPSKLDFHLSIKIKGGLRFEV